MAPPPFVASAAALLSQQRTFVRRLGEAAAAASPRGNSTLLRLYTERCPMVGASVGQHLRHSLAHYERLLDAAETKEPYVYVRYDDRARGGDFERCLVAAEAALARAEGRLLRIDDGREADAVVPVFLLSAGGEEFASASTLGREVAFVAHHAIHHNAMVRVICGTHPELSEAALSLLPPYFGSAPSTTAAAVSVSAD